MKLVCALLLYTEMPDNLVVLSLRTNLTFIPAVYNVVMDYGRNVSLESGIFWFTGNDFFAGKHIE